MELVAGYFFLFLLSMPVATADTVVVVPLDTAGNSSDYGDAMAPSSYSDYSFFEIGCPWGESSASVRAGWSVDVRASEPRLPAIL
jgi:hypothetical protein